MTIGGIEVKHFNNLKIRYDVSGYGESGLIGGQLSFSLPIIEYPDTSGLFPAGTVVRLTCSSGLEIPYFYVSSRVPSGNAVNFTCIDRSYTAERQFLLADDEYITEKDSAGNAVQYAPISTVMNNIVSICGYSGYSDTTGILGDKITRIKKDDLSSKSCRDIIDSLTESCVCFAMVQGDTGSSDKRGVLVFVGIETGMGSVFEADVSKYKSVFCGGVKTFSSVTVTSGTNTYTAGSSSSVFGGIEIDTQFASAALAGAVYDRLRDYTYKSWECDKMLLDNFIPVPSSIISFPDYGNLVTNYCDVSLTATGIYASLGRNAVSEDEIGYISRTDREIKRRYRVGDVKGNTVIDEDGVKIVYENKNGETEKYGFTSFAGGVAEYAGAMLSAVQPVGKIEDTADNVVSFLGKLGDKTFRWKAVEGDDGTVSLSREEVTSDG